MRKLSISFIVVFLLIVILNFSFVSGSTMYNGVNNATATFKNMSYNDIDSSFAKGDIMRMTALSVVRGNGSGLYYPKNKLKREEALAMILRLMGKEKDVQVAQNSASGGVPGAAGTTSSGMVDSWAQGVITVAKNAGLLSKQEQSLDFTKNATRQEIANWIAKGINLAPVYGKDAQYVYSYKDSSLFDADKLPYIEATIESSIMSGYNNGYFGPNDSITREQMAAVLSRAFNVSYAMMGYTKDEGYIEDIERDNVDGGVRHTYVLKNDSGQDIALVAESSPNANYDFVVLKNGKAGLSSIISNGDRLTYYTNGSNVIFAETDNGSIKTISGTIDSIWQGSFRLVDDSGNSYVIYYNNNTQVTMNSVDASISDLKYGETAKVTVYGSTATRIDVVYTDLSENGQVSLGDRQDSGKIVDIETDNSQVSITLDNGSTYTVNADMPVVGTGAAISASDLKVGEYIKLYFSSINTKTPDEIFLEDDYNKPVAVIRGTISGVSGFNPKIQLKDVEIYRQGQWSATSSYAMYSLDGASVYLDGSKIPVSDISKYKGYDAYIMLENHYGTETATLVSIQSGFNMSYVGDITYDGNTMLVTFDNENDNRQVNVNDGTIILDNGLLVPKSQLSKASQAYVSFSRGGAANFISILDTSAPSEYYYAFGKIDEVTSDSITIGKNYNAYALDANEWNKIDDKTFYVGDKTYIIDNSGNTPTIVDYNDFINQKYGKDLIKYGYVYIVARKDKYDNDNYDAIAINIYTNSSSDSESYDLISTDRVSKAVLSSSSGNVLTLDNVMDWNGFNNKWELNTSLDSIDVSKAVIVKNNKVISVNDLKSGDNLYIIRDGVDGIIITVE
ncbi:S-layer domain protein [Thermoanaerobacterium thermosaccharolyticum DSM 571]|uniref:S-layer domain protein n=1 Tax=Thermoanaerobacterium thermosaccharolyticum (strain ATCC 7956 / DSM 571 / NCIMB 9385 / NCA 3814 / NCTC 13789 / WDCM 00135 / 2032) TaxID=580327 RepID=D9TTT1_THETC|nr:S-layer homology domain-containing protein [Thermoanaerobacterium thermosaccharolyticum]ADL69971.1 S-layer domain protein [Thermoanaerobacterium thermosaccharolyticum DSM 571]